MLSFIAMNPTTSRLHYWVIWLSSNGWLVLKQHFLMFFMFCALKPPGTLQLVILPYNTPQQVHTNWILSMWVSYKHFLFPGIIFEKNQFISHMNLQKLIFVCFFLVFVFGHVSCSFHFKSVNSFGRWSVFMDTGWNKWALWKFGIPLPIFFEGRKERQGVWVGKVASM